MAQLDPFDISVSGAKIPDSTVIPSISTTDVEQVTLASSAVLTDLNGMAFRPAYTWGTVNATAGAAVTWGIAYATNAINRSKRTAYNSAIELFRPVAHAIRISSSLAPTTASGFVHIAISTESEFGNVTWTYPTTVAQISGCQFYKRVTLASLTQSPLTIINKWMDETAFRYNAPNSDVATGTSMSFHTDRSWGTIVILTEGAPVSSNILSAEHLLISEGIPQKDGPILGSPAAANSPGVIASTASMVSNSEPTHTEGDQQGYIERGLNHLAAGARAQGEAVFNQVAVPLLQHAGQQSVNMASAYAYQAMFGRGGLTGVNSNAGRLAVG